MSESPPSKDEITSWTRAICVVVGVKSVAWNDGTIGLVDVPMKYMAVIDAMHQGMCALAAGKPLPRLIPTEQPRKRKARR